MKVVRAQQGASVWGGTQWGIGVLGEWNLVGVGVCMMRGVRLKRMGVWVRGTVCGGSSLGMWAPDTGGTPGMGVLGVRLDKEIQMHGGWADGGAAHHTVTPPSPRG